MAKLTPFALAAIALLAACSTTPQPATPTIATIVHPLHAGTGVVQAVMPAPVMVSAGAGSSQPLQRLEIKMSDGKVQYVDTPSREIAKGDRIQLGADGIIRKV
jgi:uncharacterized lipoprotein YajG